MVNLSKGGPLECVWQDDIETIDQTGIDLRLERRAYSLSGKLGSTATPYVTAIGYAPQGAVGALSYGNQVVSIWNYDQQLRPSTYWDTLNNDGSKFLRSVSLGWYGNGNLAGMTTQAGGPGVLASLPSFAQTFQYDNVNRLTSASETNGWSQAYRYDAFGNLLQWGDVNNPQTNAFVNNQVNVTPMPSPYDKAGNQTMIDGDMLTYDALNRLAIITEPKSLNEGSASYLYDGQGQRVETIANGIPIVYVYDALGKLAAEYAVGNQPAAPCQTCYLSWDHLGTPRMVTDSSGTVVARHDYYPFGGEIAVGTGPRTNIWDASDTIRQKFTGKERDETGLDYFGARFYGLALGRFTSPDKPLVDQDSDDPQSWNLYGYVRNNPLRAIDPDGLKCVGTSNGPADDGTGGGCEAAGVNKNGSITPQQFTVTDKGQMFTEQSGITYLLMDNGRRLPVAEKSMQDATNEILNAVPAAKLGLTLGKLSLIGGPLAIVIGKDALQHVLARHAANTLAQNVSKFAAGLSKDAVEGLINAALKDGVVTQGSKVVFHDLDLGVSIGTNQAGQATSTIRVLVDNATGKAITAYPK